MRKYFALLFIFLLLPAVVAARAQADSSMAPWEFRQVWNDFLTATAKVDQANLRLGGSVGAPDIESARSKFDSLTDTEVQAIIDSFPDVDLFAHHVAELVAITNKQQETLNQKADSLSASSTSSQLVAPLAAPMLFSPAYPTGADYDVFTATLGGFGLLYDGPDAGTATNDERCDSNGEAGQQIALAVEKVVCELAYIAADAAPADFLSVAVRASLFAGVAICTGVTVATEITIAQCDLQDGLVDGAEIEAAYENSKIISGQVDSVSTELSTHDTDIKSVISQHDTDIKNDIDVHDTEIKDEINIHDTEIKAALGQHDADIKVLLANIQAVVDANGQKLDTLLERQLEVVRLLHTPSGRRESDIPACDGGPCDWPN